MPKIGAPKYIKQKPTELRKKKKRRNKQYYNNCEDFKTPFSTMD